MTVMQISDYRRRKTRLRKRQAHRHRLNDGGSSGPLIACVMILACVVLFSVVAGAESYLGWSGGYPSALVWRGHWLDGQPPRRARILSVIPL